MKRLIIDGVIFGLQKAGGISRVWAEALLGLDQGFALKNKVYLLMPTNSNVEWERIKPRLQNISIIKRNRFRWKRRGFFQESLYLTAIAALLRPDLWHSSYYVGVPLCFSGHKIAMFYDMIPEVLGNSASYDTAMKYRTLKKSDTIISISKHSRQDLGHFWPQFYPKARVIHLCRPEKNECEERDEWVSFPYFVFVGKRGGYKNFLTSLKIILSDPLFKNYHLIAAGGEPNWTSEELSVIKKFNAENRVHCEGVLPYEEIQRLISLSTAVLYPSLYEGFGLPILEAFDYGVPVLACRSSSIPEITGEDYPLADPKNPESLSKILKQLINERQHWVSYAKQRLELFPREKMLESWSELYMESTGSNVDAL